MEPAPQNLAWGWSDPKKIHRGEIWRFFTPTFLHGHFEHIAGNVAGQLYMGSGIESGIGVWRMFFLYIISGLGGITLSMCVRPNAHGVGASTAVFGLVGFFVSYIFTNWSEMGRVTNRKDECCGQRVYLVVFTSTLILMNLNIGPGSDSHIDNWGHLGGLITGIFAGLALTE